MTDKQLRPNAQPWRGLIAQGFVRVEDAVYVGLGTLLAAIALVLLVAVAVAFVQALLGATLPDRAVDLLPDPPDLDDHRAPLHRAVLLPRARARAGALPDRRVDRRDPAPVGAHRRVRATPREGRARVPRSDARAGPADGDDRGPRRLARDPAKALSSSCRRRRGGAAVTDFFFA